MTEIMLLSILPLLFILPQLSMGQQSNDFAFTDVQSTFNPESMSFEIDYDGVQTATILLATFMSIVGLSCCICCVCFYRVLLLQRTLNAAARSANDNPMGADGRAHQVCVCVCVDCFLS